MRTAAVARRRIWLPLLALALAVGVAAQTETASAADQPVSRSGMIWMITLRSLHRLSALPGSGELVKTFFSSDRYSILVGGPHSRFPALSAQRSQAFGSYQSLRSGVKGSGSPRLVILDLEHWAQTPLSEQRHPARYYRLAARLARRKGLLLVATPSANLVRPWPVRVVPAYTSYLKSGLVAQVAKSADIFEVQAQGFERNTALYKEFVSAAADQAHDANPRIVVIAGLSTNPGGRAIPAAQLYRDAVAARPYVDGFWLNIPERSSACRRCGVARPQIALELLHRLMHQGTFLPGARRATVAARLRQLDA